MKNTLKSPRLFHGTFRTAVAVFSLLFSLSSTALAFGEGSGSSTGATDNANPLTYDAKLIPQKIEVGGTTQISIELRLAEHYHAYLDRLKLAVEHPDDLKLAPLKVEPIVEFYDPVSKSQKKGIENRALVTALLEIPVGFLPGPQNLRLKLSYQACTADFCLFPKHLEILLPLDILPAGAPGIARSGSPENAKSSEATLSEPSAANGKKSSEFENALNSGLLSAFALVFVVGFLTSLTPCIYPMIPITMVVLGARSHQKSHWRNFTLALTYVLGIALTYATLGLIAASTGSLFGAALGNIWVVSAIAVLFFIMGLSMFGFYEVQAPGFIRNRLGATQTNQGIGGAFITGLIAGVVASPCVGPVLVSVLAYIAQTQNRLLGFTLLFTFALGMGLPFIALGLSSSALSRLPKAGNWMEAVKVLFGTVMCGMAFYYIKPIYPTWLFQILLGLSCAFLGFKFGAFKRTSAKSLGARARRLLLMGIVIGGTTLATLGALSRAGYQLAGISNGTKPTSLMKWQPYDEASFSQALQSGQAVLVDFTAEWCGACHEMEETTFLDRGVVEASQGFQLFKVDGTEDTEELRTVLTRFKVQGFPTYLFFDPSGSARPDLTVDGYMKASEFLLRMRSAQSSVHDQQPLQPASEK